MDRKTPSGPFVTKYRASFHQFRRHRSLLVSTHQKKQVVSIQGTANGDPNKHAIVKGVLLCQELSPTSPVAGERNKLCLSLSNSGSSFIKTFYMIFDIGKCIGCRTICHQNISFHHPSRNSTKGCKAYVDYSC